MPENERVEPKPIDIGDYQFGFHDDVKPIASTGKGPTKEAVREISRIKGEPEWMLDFRLKSLEIFYKMPMQEWGPDLTGIDFDDIIYYQKPTDKPARSWEEVPEKIKDTFEKIGIPEAERAYLAGASAQYESEVVYHNIKEEYDKLGIVFTDTDSALKEYPELFKKYFTDYTVNIRPAGSTDISFDKNETRAAYVKPGKISIYLSGSKQQGNKVTFEAATIENAKARQHYRLKFDVQAG